MTNQPDSVEEIIEKFDELIETTRGLVTGGAIINSREWETAIKDCLRNAITQAKAEERERLRHLVCPCACDMFIDEDGYEEAHRGEMEALQDKK